MVVFGIRAEEKDQERRVPLVPKDLAELTRRHPDLRVRVERSPLRSFEDQEMAAVDGVELVDSLDDVPVVLAVKEIPVKAIRPDRTYVFFSHTFKGQRANMEMLQTLLDRRCTLIDYEMLVEDVSEEDFEAGFEAAVRQAAERGHDIGDRLPTTAFQARTVHFCRFAGIVGAYDSLGTLGRRLQAEGMETPFADLEPAVDLGSWAAARERVQKVCAALAADGVPEPLRPLVIGVTGYSRNGKAGKTAAGAVEVLEELGARRLDLAGLAGLEGGDSAVHWVSFDRSATGNREAMEDHLSRLTLLINCVRWMPWEDSFLTRDFARRLWADRQPRLRVVGDVSADAGGSVEFCVPTTLENPVYVYEPHRDDLGQAVWRDPDKGKWLLEEGPCRWGMEGRGPVVLGVDNLPTAFSREASEEFSGYLVSDRAAGTGASSRLPYQMALLGGPDADALENLEGAGVSRPLRRAIMAFRGELTPDYRYLQRYLDDWGDSK